MYSGFDSINKYSRCTGLPLMIICTMMNASKGCHCRICVAGLLVTHLHRMRPTGTRPIGMLEFQLLGQQVAGFRSCCYCSFNIGAVRRCVYVLSEQVFCRYIFCLTCGLCFLELLLLCMGFTKSFSMLHSHPVAKKD